MADNSQMISGVAERYASSLFDVANEAGSVDAVAQDLDRFEAMINESDDLRRLVKSPVFSAQDQMDAMVALFDKAKISGLVSNFIKVVVGNNRLFAMPEIIRSFRETAARNRGEVTADVRAAHALDAEQMKELADVLSAATGKTVSVRLGVDPSLLGGLIVKIGSRQIDTSIRTKLSTLKLSLKEVG